MKSWIRDNKIQIREKHPGSATLVAGQWNGLVMIRFQLFRISGPDFEYKIRRKHFTKNRKNLHNERYVLYGV
jgi:hypothetical protein